MGLITEKLSYNHCTAQIKSLYKNNSNILSINQECIFEDKAGLKEGCIISPLLFSSEIDKPIKKDKEKILWDIGVCKV